MKTNVAQYYFTPGGQFYSDKLACFVVECNTRSSGAVIDRISRVFTRIYIDEVQDLAGYDLEVIKLLFGSRSSVLLIGDPRQVVYLTHCENKYKKYSYGKIKDFIETECKQCTCEIDENSLNITYRNCPDICSLADTLYPDHPVVISKQEKTTGHDGAFLVSDKHVEAYLRQYKPVQLRWKTTTNVHDMYPVYNFGESKGLEFDCVLIYATKPFEQWIENHDSTLQPESRAKFYVALTRARYSAAIVTEKTHQALPRWVPN